VYKQDSESSGSRPLLVSYSFLVALFSLFAVALASNATPFFGASYTLLSAGVLAAFGPTLEGFGVVVVVTALGASLGKVILYTGAWGLRRRLYKNKNIKLFGNWVGRRSFYLGLFITALIPGLPLDDYVYIGAGANNAKLTPMVGVTYLAKVVKGSVEISVELSGLSWLVNLNNGGVLGLTRLEFSLLLSGIFIVIGVVVYKLDWAKIIEKVLGKDVLKKLQ
jgi:hypothetical protein